MVFEDEACEEVEEREGEEEDTDKSTFTIACCVGSEDKEEKGLEVANKGDEV